jgi:MFS family permease
MLTITSSIGMLAGAVQSTVLVLFLTRDLAFPPAMVGLIFTCAGFGSFIGALCAGLTARRIGVGPTLMLGKALWVLGGLLLGCAGLAGGELAFVIVGQVLISGGSTVYFVNQISLRQAITSVHLLGRVTAARRFMLFGTAVLGAALGGVLGETLGLRGTLLVGVAVLCSELVLIIYSPIRHAHV